MVGVDRSKMRLFDLADSVQKQITDSGQDDGPVFDNSSFGTKFAGKFEEFKL